MGKESSPERNPKSFKELVATQVQFSDDFLNHPAVNGTGIGWLRDEENSPALNIYLKDMPKDAIELNDLMKISRRIPTDVNLNFVLVGTITAAAGQ